MLYQKIQVKIQTFLIPILFISFYVENTFSQDIPLNTKHRYINTCEQELLDSVINKTKTDYPFIIGRYHNPVYNNASYPYLSNEWSKGSLIYDNKTYPVEGLKYDIAQDKLIYLFYTDNYTMNPIALDENFIPEFNMLSTKFRYFKELKNKLGVNLKDGYYEVVYDGTLKFLVRKEKTEAIDANTMFTQYEVKTNMYLLKNDRMIRIKTMNKLINQLKDKKKDVRNLVRNNYLKLNTSSYSSAFQVLEFYENNEK